MSASIHSPGYLLEGNDLARLLRALAGGDLGKAARDEAAAACARFVTQQAELAGLQVDKALDFGAQQILQHIRDHGFAGVQNVFTPAEVDAVTGFLRGKTPTFLDSAGERRAVPDLAARPPGADTLHYDEADLCRCPEIYRLLHGPKLTNLVSAYMGAPATVSSVAAWWRFPPARPPAQPQFHHDPSDFSTFRLFVNMTDVTVTTGPHAYIAGSHDTARLKAMAEQRFNAAQTTQFWEWLELGLKVDSEVANYFMPADIHAFIGGRGASLLEDARGLHKDITPENGPRLALAISYTVLPLGGEPRAQVPRRELPFAQEDAADVARLSPLVRYATRQLYA